MKYINPSDIESSYRENDLGKTLYDFILQYKPKKIVEIGILGGYSTIVMAQALDEWGEGHIFAYDLFEKYPFKHSSVKEVQDNMGRYSVSKYITLVQKDFYDWIKNPEDFDLLHVDISNNGEIIELLYSALKDRINNGAVVLFEGGSSERDNIEWMKKNKFKKIGETAVPFKVIDGRFPSLSMIKKI